MLISNSSMNFFKLYVELNKRKHFIPLVDLGLQKTQVSESSGSELIIYQSCVYLTIAVPFKKVVASFMEK